VNLPDLEFKGDGSVLFAFRGYYGKGEAGASFLPHGILEGKSGLSQVVIALGGKSNTWGLGLGLQRFSAYSAVGLGLTVPFPNILEAWESWTSSSQRLR